MAAPVVTVREAHGRRYASTGSKWEPIVGYSRAVRTGDVITVTGTAGVNSDGTYPEGVAAQAGRAFEILLAAVAALGGAPTDIVRTRMFVTDIAQWEALGRVHGEIFGEIRPCTTMVEVTKLIDKDALVEIEADAIVLR
jgi:enamine deaminase RidA (YjgF/YER057c/UK114 family)